MCFLIFLEQQPCVECQMSSIRYYKELAFAIKQTVEKPPAPLIRAGEINVKQRIEEP